MTKDTRTSLSVKKLDIAKNKNLGNLLIRTARIYNEMAITIAKQKIDPRITSSHTTLIAHIDWEGTRITDLSSKIGITKQAVGQLVFELEKLGVLKRIPDPQDGRAKLIVFTNKGKEILINGLNILAGIEKEISKQIGKSSVSDIKNNLRLLQDALDTISNSDS